MYYFYIYQSYIFYLYQSSITDKGNTPRVSPSITCGNNRPHHHSRSLCRRSQDAPPDQCVLVEGVGGRDINGFLISFLFHGKQKDRAVEMPQMKNINPSFKLKHVGVSGKLW